MNGVYIPHRQYEIGSQFIQNSHYVTTNVVSGGYVTTYDQGYSVSNSIIPIGYDKERKKVIVQYTISIEINKDQVEIGHGSVDAVKVRTDIGNLVVQGTINEEDFIKNAKLI